jgi:hypothetical protein
MMKNIILLLTSILSFSALSSFAQKTMSIDLHDAVQKKKIEVIDRELTLINEEAFKGIRLSKAFGEGLAWLKGIDFSNGTIEFDIRGENVEQHSFVGIAFHGQNDSTFDAIYLRPFRFDDTDSNLRKRMIQYVSLPTYTWRKLRAEFPDQYEAAIVPAPDPNAWVHVRIIVKDASVTTYINGDKSPSLVVNKVTSTHSGTIGFYVADTSGGDFANIKISKL